MFTSMAQQLRWASQSSTLFSILRLYVCRLFLR